MLLYHGSNVEVSNPQISDCIPYILQFYDNEALENAYADIDKLIESKKLSI